MRKVVYKLLTFSVGVLLFLFSTANYSAHGAQGASLLLDPTTGAVTVDATFDVSILLDTGGLSVNAVEVYLEFPADKLQIVSPSTGNSIIALWLQQPAFSNQKGTISFVGGIPGNGIRTSSGLISTVTFRAKASGQAVIKLTNASAVLAADGRGTKITSTLGRAVFDVIPKAPEGPTVFSVTHPDQDVWYRNNNVQVGWDAQEGVTAYSYVLDREPSTIPPNEDITTSTGVGMPNIADGIWYFHVKQKRNDLYGDTSHYRVKIDATPPAEFKPTIDFLAGAIAQSAIVSFFTTDSLSAVNHYEVAVYDRSQEAGQAPVFVEAASPHRIPDLGFGDVRIVVRAFDNAGNTQDGFVDFSNSHFILSFFTTTNVLIFLAAVIFIGVFRYLLSRIMRNREVQAHVTPHVLAPIQYEYEDQEPENPHQT